jgi:hypothetical protein
MPQPVLDYETPQPLKPAPPEPVGRRTLVAGLVAVAASLALAAAPHVESVLLVIGCAAGTVLSFVAFVEAVFFPRNVSDRGTALVSSAVNAVCGAGLLVVRHWFR